MTHALDLGADDVHLPASMPLGKRKKKKRKAPDMKKSTGGALSAVFRLADVVLDVTSCSEDGKPIWIQIAKQGSWKGHPAGPFSMTLATFGEIVRNFEATQNRRIPVDFEHASEAPASDVASVGAPAQGWITALEIRADGNLWGLAEWGDLARQYIKGGQYRFLSPAIVFNSKDRVTGVNQGARLSSVGLTNSPFLDAMQPVAAKDSGGADDGDGGAAGASDAISAIRDALEMPDYAGPEQLLAALKAIETADVAGTLAGPGRVALGPGTFFNRIRDGLRMSLLSTRDDVFAAAKVACGEAATTSPTNVRPAVPAQKKEKTMSDAEDPKLAKLEATNSELTLRLKASEADAAKIKSDAEIAMKALVDENAALKTKIAEHETKAHDEAVEAALATYGENRSCSKGLKAEDRPALLSFVKASPEAFKAMYPVIPADQRHLTQDLTTGGAAGDKKSGKKDKAKLFTDRAHQAASVAANPGAPHSAGAGAQVISLSDIAEEMDDFNVGEYAAELRAKNPKLSYDESFSMAVAKQSKMFKKAVRKAGGDD